MIGTLSNWHIIQLFLNNHRHARAQPFYNFHGAGTYFKGLKIAGPNCTATTTGYWKSSNAPVCDECTKYGSKTTKATNENSGSTSATTAAGEQHSETQHPAENNSNAAATEAAATQAPAQ